MSKILTLILSTVIIMFDLLMSSGCNKNGFKSGGPQKNDEIKKKILDLDKEKIQELLQNTNQDGKKVSVCMYYKEVSGSIGTYSKPSSHHCDAAIFNVLFNDTKLSKQLNLNNRTVRTVTGISGKTYTVGEDNSGYNGFGYHQGYVSPPVPGTVFEGAWKDNKFVINTTCGLDPNAPGYMHKGQCHEGIASFSLIGKVTLSYEGQTVDMFLTASEATIDTGREYTYNFSDFTLEDTEYKFGDYCELNQ